MTTPLITLALLVCVALAGWAFAEFKTKAFSYNEDQAEIEAKKRVGQQLKDNNFDEMSIKDVIRNISTKGFNA